MAWVLSGILVHMGHVRPAPGRHFRRALIWFGFVLTTIAVNNAFSGRSLMLTVIDAGHWLGALIIIGAVVGWLDAKPPTAKVAGLRVLSRIGAAVA